MHGGDPIATGRKAEAREEVVLGRLVLHLRSRRAIYIKRIEEVSLDKNLRACLSLPRNLRVSEQVEKFASCVEQLVEGAHKLCARPCRATLDGGEMLLRDSLLNARPP